MLVLYAGFPGALEGLRLLHREWPGPRPRRTREGDVATWWRRGSSLCRQVYGPAIAKLLPAVRALHPDLERWMIEHGYGRVLARPGLGLRDRELVTVAALAALGWERQLVSHVLGALRVGAPAAAVHEALAIGARAGGARERATATRTWARAARYIREGSAREGSAREGSATPRAVRPAASPAAGPHPKPARF